MHTKGGGSVHLYAFLVSVVKTRAIGNLVFLSVLRALVVKSNCTPGPETLTTATAIHKKSRPLAETALKIDKHCFYSLSLMSRSCTKVSSPNNSTK